MRCPDCGKMVSYGEPEVDAGELWFNTEQTAVEGPVSLSLPCAECGLPLKSYTEDLSLPIEHECPKAGQQDCDDCEGIGTVSCEGCDGTGEIEADCDECNSTGKVKDTCDECDGKGSDRWGGTCEKCAGEGQAEIDCEYCDGNGSRWVTCPYCEEGNVECSECGGTGQVDGGEVDYSWGTVDTETYDRYQDKDAKGKPIKSQRYMKHFYGAHITVDIECDLCNETLSLKHTLEAQASAFDEVV